MSLISSVRKIDEMYVSTPKNGRKIEVEAMACWNDMCVVKLKGGGIWTSWRQVRQYCLTLGGWNPQVYDYLKCLMALRLITRKEFQEHKDVNEQARRQRELADDQHSIDRLAKEYGFKAPKLKRKAGGK